MTFCIEFEYIIALIITFIQKERFSWMYSRLKLIDIHSVQPNVQFATRAATILFLVKSL